MVNRISHFHEETKLHEELMRVQSLLNEARREHERRKKQVQQLDLYLDELAVKLRDDSKSPAQKSTRRGVTLAPHPSPLSGTPHRTGETAPVPSYTERSKWTSQTDESCGPSARPSFTAYELHAAREAAMFERMAGLQPGEAETDD